jgi:hypothetical protein
MPLECVNNSLKDTQPTQSIFHDVGKWLGRIVKEIKSSVINFFDFVKEANSQKKFSAKEGCLEGCRDAKCCDCNCGNDGWCPCLK